MKKIVYIVTALLLLSCAKENSDKIPDNEFYTCSMDPQVMEKKPGKCPICKMDLTKVIIDQHNVRELKLSKEQEHLANLQTVIVTEGELGKENTVNGRIVINENNLTRISSRISGRIEKLFIKNPGETVKPGTLLYEVYSEELMAAQKEYLLGLDHQKQRSGSDIDVVQLTDASKNKLLLWGMSETQIKKLASSHEVKNTVPIYSKSGGIITTVNAREGGYLMDGDVLFEIADLSTVWVEAELYADEINEYNTDDPVTIRVNEFPGEIWNSRITFAAPQLTGQSKINILRAELTNKEGMLKPGMQANVSLRASTRKTLFIPSQAALQDSKGTTAWVKKKNGAYESRMIITGIQGNDKVEVRTGIEAGEEVVIKGAYLLQSEYLFKKGMSMKDHDMSNK